MCGIYGIVKSDGGVGAQSVDAGLDAQRHRGPDAEGRWADRFCALGHRRLAIIDLSEAGRQPMSNEDGTVWVTFNGEVYNFESLRDELERLGHRFRTRTDTECIVHAYEQWGTACVSRLRGMFAFGIWDQRSARLFLARDRVGKKPIVYSQQGDTFRFASEIQGLLADGSIRREVDVGAIDAYLTWGYVPPPATGLRGIYKLPAAHWMTVDVTPEGLVAQTERYWELEYEPKQPISEAEAAEALRETMREAVRLRMISDVPLGAFLSGGIDSSIVVGLMAQLSSRPVKTFSIGFDEAAYNELEHARRVAQRWGCEHQEFMVRPDALAVLPMLARHYGEPFADEAALPTYYLSRMTRESVTVALNGDGGDESFLGYERYLANRMAEAARRVPGSNAAAALLTKALPETGERKGVVRKARRFLAAAHLGMAERYQRWHSYFDDDAKLRLYSGDMLPAARERRQLHWMQGLFDGVGDLDPAEAAMAVDVQSYLPYDLLAKVDIAAMANSLEGRSPFLDHEVMELAAKLPASLKLRGRESKYLLKRAFADLMPPENARRGKMGFGVPVGEWFRTTLRDFLNDAVLSERSLGRGYFQPQAVRELIQEHQDRKTDRSLQLWNLLMLELWHREVVEAAPRVASAV